MQSNKRTALVITLVALAAAACAATPTPTPMSTATPTSTPMPVSRTTPPPTLATQAVDRTAELQKFDHPQDYLPKTGPGGTQWDRHYRSFIQTDQDATAKGLPTHAQAAAEIKADAALSSEKLQMHKGYVLFIKHYSQAYRPESATRDLWQLYVDLVDMEFGVTVQATATPAGLPFAHDSRLRIYRDVVYGTEDEQAQRMDVYLVATEKPAPVVLEIHGGGWRRGGKSQFSDVYPGNLIGRILEAGISVISIDYRLTPTYQHPAQVQDVARAIQFIRSRALEWGIDAQHIATMGGSAGAHLGAWVALHDDMAQPSSRDPIARQSTRLNCFVDMWGPMDLTRADPLALSRESARGEDFAKAYIALFGTTLEGYTTIPEIRARIRDASPLFMVTADDPPALIISAGQAELALADHPPVPETINDPHSAWHGVLLADRMASVGVNVVRYIGPHVGKDPDADNTVIVRFLRECLAVR